MDPTNCGSLIQVSGHIPIRIFVTKNGNQHRMNTPITIPGNFVGILENIYQKLGFYTENWQFLRKNWTLEKIGNLKLKKLRLIILKSGKF